MTLYMKLNHICPTDIRDILLWKCKQKTMTDKETDRWGTPDNCHTNSTFGLSELKRQLKRQRVPNPSIFLCLNQFRSYQNDLACIQNVKKTALAIFCFSSFDTSWKFQNSLTFEQTFIFPWHNIKFPDNSLTLKNFKFPWHFPDAYEPCRCCIDHANKS